MVDSTTEIGECIRTYDNVPHKHLLSSTSRTALCSSLVKLITIFANRLHPQQPGYLDKVQDCCADLAQSPRGCYRCCGPPPILSL
ncbi:hypothetical protein PABG_11568 [Paracoccidioides brasiliensis Pb03]|nr:hypothetical protein PABG_11568 [Paracoccidioides brasiliensis Pb03]